MNQEIKKHIIVLLDKDTRLDGRKLTDYRKPVSVEYGISKSAEGSARVKIGDTEVIAGVKLAIETPYPDTPDKGLLMVGAELTPLSSPEFELGPPGIQAIEIARVIDRGIRESKAIDMEKLCIKEGEEAWSVMIDIIPINDAGNLFDAGALATLAALKDTVFPKVVDGVIDYKEKTKDKLPLSKQALSVTVLKIGKNLIVDPIPDEEKVLDARISVATDEKGTIVAMQKGGEEPLEAEEIMKMVELGIEKGKELRKAL